MVLVCVGVCSVIMVVLCAGVVWVLVSCLGRVLEFPPVFCLCVVLCLDPMLGVWMVGRGCSWIGLIDWPVIGIGALDRDMSIFVLMMSCGSLVVLGSVLAMMSLPMTFIDSL